MKDEEEVKQPEAVQVDPEEQAKRDMMSKHVQKFKMMYENDKKWMAENDNSQAPLSRAYTSGCSFTKQKALSQEEEKQMMQGFHIDKSKQLESLDATKELRELIRKNLITDGNFPQGKIDPLFQDSSLMQLPPDLVKAYLNMQRAAIKFRLAEDDDFKHTGDAYPHLKKL